MASTVLLWKPSQLTWPTSCPGLPRVKSGHLGVDWMQWMGDGGWGMRVCAWQAETCNIICTPQLCNDHHDNTLSRASGICQSAEFNEAWSSSPLSFKVPPARSFHLVSTFCDDGGSIHNGRGQAPEESTAHCRGGERRLGKDPSTTVSKPLLQHTKGKGRLGQIQLVWTRRRGGKYHNTNRKICINAVHVFVLIQQFYINTKSI